ncbi:hypothetical protein [Corynebacterium sp. A21]|uniref:hypothetical protein n=1 Tax=Corynebacterium sp. A21 TaxID=3457318 RepID=UPI003FD345DB
MNRRGIRQAAIALAGAAALLLGGCADSAGPNPATTSVQISTPAEAATPQSRSDDGRSDDDQRDRGSEMGSSAPCEVAGYSAEGEQERNEEGFSDQQVRDAVAQGCATADLDDGAWEIDLDWIEVDIRQDGTVVNVDD